MPWVTGAYTHLISKSTHGVSRALHQSPLLYTGHLWFAVLLPDPLLSSASIALVPRVR